LSSVAADPASLYYPSCRSRAYSTSPFSSYLPLAGNYGSNPYPYWYGQGYSGSTSPNIQMYPQSPYFSNPYLQYPMQGSLFGGGHHHHRRCHHCGRSLSY
ncbi:hypothetical protein M378DRAFT_172690, partial [Amanita muscaria Koide BX008]